LFERPEQKIRTSAHLIEPRTAADKPLRSELAAYRSRARPQALRTAAFVAVANDALVQSAGRITQASDRYPVKPDFLISECDRHLSSRSQRHRLFKPVTPKNTSNYAVF
jgi:hypothetical protein